jgi:hypothetical protein
MHAYKLMEAATRIGEVFLEVAYLASQQMGLLLPAL